MLQAVFAQVFMDEVIDSRARSSGTDYAGEQLAARLLLKVFERVPASVAVRLWNGQQFKVGAGVPADASEPPFALVFRNPRAVADLVLGRDPLRLAEAYFRSDVDIEGNLFAALMLKDHLEALRTPLRDRIAATLMALRLRSLNSRPMDARDALSGGRGVRAQSMVKAHSKDENSDAVQFHYDVSNEFYRLWLDRAMVYSCGYFETAESTLDEAQEAKLEHICRKLLLRPNEKLLDVGCGWGALLVYAASHYGVYAHGITLSPKQLAVARERIAAAGLEGRVTVELRDYRDLGGEAVYDRVSSIGMFEHVGLKNLAMYFSRMHRLLKPGGLFLNHGITHARPGWEKNVSTQFINRYVFPDGQLDTIGNIQGEIERARFEIEDVESLRAHYALTLRAWVERLERRHTRALEYVTEATYRVWRLYMSACAREFESGQIGIYQVLATRRGDDLSSGSSKLPLTRRHMYAESSPAH
jgi:cyclopropane-fatty-acyl-phospholipid synthase